MTTQQTIEELKKVVYIAEMKQLNEKNEIQKAIDEESINSIKRAIILLENYMKATKLYMEVDKK